MSEVCDTMFMLSGAISWVNKQAQLNANAISLWESWQMIVQAITKIWAEARGPVHPHTHLLVFTPFNFYNQDGPLQEERLPSSNKCMMNLGVLVGLHTMTEGKYHNEARIVARCDETYGLHCPHHLHLHQIMDSRVTEVQCQFPHWCPSRSDRSGGSRHSHHGWCHREPRGHMKINLHSLQRWRHEGHSSISKLALRLDGVSPHWVPRCTPLPYAICSLQGYPGELVRS